jgi:hypothetical protein
MTATARITRLVHAARRLADPDDTLGKEARALLPESSGLSAEGVELGLRDCLEHRATESDIETLAKSVPPAKKVHAILARTVFTAPLRAIALCLGQSDDVDVRPSHHEPHFAMLLARACEGLFRVVPEITPATDDHVWVYGGDDTLDALRRTLSEGVVLHAHGPGFGIALVEAGSDPKEAARALADDVLPFDQRGCLSPRLAICLGSDSEVEELARALASALSEAESRVPLGVLDADEAAEVARYRDTASFAQDVLPAGRGFVGFGELGMAAPVGRNMQVTRGDLDDLLATQRAAIAAVGIFGSPSLEEKVARLLPHARRSPLGKMQRPRFDGAVDLRADPAGEVVRRG